MNDPGKNKSTVNDMVQQLNQVLDDIRNQVSKTGQKSEERVMMALQAAHGSLREAVEMLKQTQSSSQQGVPATGREETKRDSEPAGLDTADPVGGTDRSSGDPDAEFRTEIHPDDVEADPSNTGHREIHPADVE